MPAPGQAVRVRGPVAKHLVHVDVNVLNAPAASGAWRAWHKRDRESKGVNDPEAPRRQVHKSHRAPS